MSVFVSIAVAMTAFTMLWVLVPLLRRKPQSGVIAVRESNLSIVRDQLAELERDLAIGAISVEQYAPARAEVERRVLDEADALAPHATVPGGRWAAVVLGVLIPAFAVSLYLWIGEPAGFRGGAPAGFQRPAETAEQHVTPQQVDEMVAKLAARLEKNPDDARGWAMLARSYYVMQRIPEAVAAYARAVEKVTNDAGLYADYADAMAMHQGRRIEGEALALVNKALQLDPDLPKALALAGTAAFSRKDFPEALRHWEKLLPMLPPESEMAKSVAGGIADSRQLGGIKAPAMAQGATKPGLQSAPPPAAIPAAPTAGGGISGRVTLGADLAAKAAAEDIVFIVARAVNGPRVPLAVLRKRVADLPLDFRLDDTQAMSPELKLSGFAEVIVSARISKSGNAISQSGDLQGVSAPLKLDPRAGVSGLKIVIDSVVP